MGENGIYSYGKSSTRISFSGNTFVLNKSGQMPNKISNQTTFLCLLIYLFIFNLFIVDKFISVTTRIAFRKQQGLSQIPGAVNKITECWYRWYEIFETKSPFVVLIKVNPKQKRKKKAKKKNTLCSQLTIDTIS